MGNLGDYQTMTTRAKQAGGPLQLMVGIAGGGYVFFRTAEALVKWGVRALKERSVPCETMDQVFRVTSEGEHKGMKIHAGDSYRVLECDGDAVLIEVLGDPSSPYFVSSTFLGVVSDYPQNDAEEPGD